MIFHIGVDLPYFASFASLNSAEGRKVVETNYSHYAEIAPAKDPGSILDSATWSARLCYSASALDEANRQAVAPLSNLRDR